VVRVVRMGLQVKVGVTVRVVWGFRVSGFRVLGFKGLRVLGF
jgi:hypothetical protein